jgi:hypothetical protein
MATHRDRRVCIETCTAYTHVRSALMCVREGDLTEGSVVCSAQRVTVFSAERARELQQGSVGKRTKTSRTRVRMLR